VQDRRRYKDRLEPGRPPLSPVSPLLTRFGPLQAGKNLPVDRIRRPSRKWLISNAYRRCGRSILGCGSDFCPVFAGLTGWRELGRLVPSWPLIAGLAAFIRALAQPMAPLNDPDTYLHIAAGRWMLAHAALPVHDPFWHSLAGATWVPHEIAGRAVLDADRGKLGCGAGARPPAGAAPSARLAHLGALVGRSVRRTRHRVWAAFPAVAGDGVVGQSARQLHRRPCRALRELIPERLPRGRKRRRARPYRAARLVRHHLDPADAGAGHRELPRWPSQMAPSLHGRRGRHSHAPRRAIGLETGHSARSGGGSGSDTPTPAQSCRK